MIIDSSGKRVDACMDWLRHRSEWRTRAVCDNPWGWLVGMHHHEQWPAEWTPAMLEFFRDHPLQPAAAPF